MKLLLFANFDQSWLQSVFLTAGLLPPSPRTLTYMADPAAAATATRS